MPYASGGGGAFRSVRFQRLRRRPSRRARRVKRISRGIVARALETKYFPKNTDWVHTDFNVGYDTAGNFNAPSQQGQLWLELMRNCRVNIAQPTTGASNLYEMTGNKIWLKNLDLTFLLTNSDTISHWFRVLLVQYHPMFDCGDDTTGDTFFAKDSGPLHPFGAIGSATGGIVMQKPNLDLAGKFTVIKDVVVHLAPTANSPENTKLFKWRVNRGFKRLITFDQRDLDYHTNSLWLICSSSDANASAGASSTYCTPSWRIAFKDI